MNATVDMQALLCRTLVVGLGKTGYSVVRYLAAQGVQLSVADSRENPPCLHALQARYPQVPVTLGEIPTAQLSQYDHIVVSPGIALDTQQRTIGDIELFAWSADKPVIAITGSNGKSTVTMLVSRMLEADGRRAATVGNIGTPVLDCLLDPSAAEVDFYVLELSSFQLETTYSLKPRAATVLNISADHMDRYADLQAYRQAKQRILTQADKGVLNRQDRHSAPLLAAYPHAISFGLDAPDRPGQFGVGYHAGAYWFVHGQRRLARVADMQLHGAQNVANILASMALFCAAGLDLSPPAIAAALAYPGLPHRCEVVGQWQGVRWVNDSKATNVGATVAAIQGFSGAGFAPNTAAGGRNSLVLILGGQGKQADFSQLAVACNGPVRDVILFGQDADQIERALAAEPGLNAAVHRAASLSAAVTIAQRHADAGQTVLFSPACASFDLFDGFEQRGDAFKRLVTQLVKRLPPGAPEQ